MGGFVLEGVHEFEAALARIVGQTKIATASAGAEAARSVADDLAARAPVRSGNLVGSIGVFGPFSEKGDVVYAAGVAAVYGRRVALGFHGTDSLGRTYDQQGQDFVGPAVSKAPARMSEVYGRRWALAMSR